MAYRRESRVRRPWTTTQNPLPPRSPNGTVHECRAVLVTVPEELRARTTAPTVGCAERLSHSRGRGDGERRGSSV